MHCAVDDGACGGETMPTGFSLEYVRQTNIKKDSIRLSIASFFFHRYRYGGKVRCTVLRPSAIFNLLTLLFMHAMDDGRCCIIHHRPSY